ncbi:MAG: DNA translocase FtsK [Cytophagales bacterium]|nr:MAG: DNA translocase FtsK [Cytophagales bacterium]
MATKKRTQYKKTKSSPHQISLWDIIYKDKRFGVMIGLLLMLMAIIMFLSFFSYFFTGQADQSIVESLWSGHNSRVPRGKLENLMGFLGAVISYLFIYKWFGVASFLFVPWIFNIGYKLVFSKSLFREWRFIKSSLFLLFWVSAFLGYIVLTLENESTWAFLCGEIGYDIAILLNSLLGWATTILLVFTLIIYLMYTFGLHTFYAVTDRLPQIKITSNTKEPKTKETTQPVADDKIKREPLEDHFSLREFSFSFKENLKNALNNATNPPKDSSTTPIGEEGKLELASGAYVEEEEEIATVDNKEVDFIIDDGTLDEEDIIEEDDGQLGFPFKVEIKIPDAKVPANVRFGNYDPRLDLSSYRFPEIDLLDPTTDSRVRVTKEELESNKDRIVETLSHFKIGIQSIKATIGPTVTLYEIVPQAGVKISKIKNLEDDIALSLSALGIRIIAPIPGRGTIGIEVPNKNREIVRMSMLMNDSKFRDTDKELPIALGKTISNEVFVADLAKMPHLLMAGATGQGKSVGLNVILTSLLFKKHPSELKFVLIDPKKVELTLYNKIERHYLATLPASEESIITDTRKVVHTLNSLCIEMEVRYDLLKTAGCRNLKEYNQKFVKRMLNPEEGHRFLPYIVLVIDELADLMMTAGKEVETPIARLAQLARAIGIHLIVATQRPSVNVITGTIKANFPARLSFRVSSGIDSRTILDSKGAEQLVGQGDMLISNGSDIIRLQCGFVDTHEVERICEFIGEQRGFDTSYSLPEFEDEGAETKAVDLAQKDSSFGDAARLVVSHQQGSTSLIQRKLSLGYNRAGRIMDQLEAAGIVGAFEGSKARKVLIADTEELDRILKSLG